MWKQWTTDFEEGCTSRLQAPAPLALFHRILRVLGAMPGHCSMLPNCIVEYLSACTVSMA